MKKTMMVMVLFFATIIAGNVYGQQAQKGLNPNINGKSNGATISKSELVTAGKITLNTSAKKVNYFMMRYMNSLQPIELVSNSENLTPEMKTAINGLKTGSEVQFNKISCKPTNNTNAAPERVGEFRLIVQ